MSAIASNSLQYIRCIRSGIPYRTSTEGQLKIDHPFKGCISNRLGRKPGIWHSVARRGSGDGMVGGTLAGLFSG